MIQKELEQKAQKWAQKLINIPFIRSICLTGSVARGRATESSDIDFLIIAKPGRIFLTRALTVLYVKLLGQYRTDEKRAGRICLNWWATKIINNKLKINWTKVGKIKLLAQKVELGWLEKGLSGEFGSILERLIKNYQITRFKKDPRTRARGSEVWWSDEEIGLHPFKKS